MSVDFRCKTRFNHFQPPFLLDALKKPIPRPCPAARLLQGVFFEAQVPQEGHGRRLADSTGDRGLGLMP